MVSETAGWNLPRRPQMQASHWWPALWHGADSLRTATSLVACMYTKLVHYTSTGHGHANIVIANPICAPLRWGDCAKVHGR
jgi:hypothetical protein